MPGAEAGDGTVDRGGTETKASDDAPAGSASAKVEENREVHDGRPVTEIENNLSAYLLDDSQVFECNWYPNMVKRMKMSGTRLFWDETAARWMVRMALEKLRSQAVKLVNPYGT